MLFSRLAHYFNRLEETTLRNQMVSILAELFKETSAVDIKYIVYLLQGRVVPLFQALEFGVADRMVIAAIALAFSVPEAEVSRKFKTLGDLGQVSETLRKDYVGEKHAKELSVAQVYKTLFIIAETTGSGSASKKVTLLAGLLRELDVKSNRYVARIPLNKLRLGFSDMTILDALSYAISETKEHRRFIEKAYNVRPDLGYIASQIKSFGTAGVAGVVPKVGTPILMAKADRVSDANEILDKIGRCAVEYKYDGLRLQVHYRKIKNQKSKIKNDKEGKLVKMYSRNLEDVTKMFPDIERAVKKQINCNEVIFEGEVVAYNPRTSVFVPFQQTMQRKRKYDIAAKALEIPVKLFVFELLYLDGVSYIHEPYEVRKRLLKKVVVGDKLIKYATEHIVDTPVAIEKLFDDSVKLGFEGIIAKRIKGEYQAGMRGFNWIKFKRAMSVKLMDTFDVLVMGYTKGEGKRTQFGVGQFLTGIYDEGSDTYVTISKVGSGLTDEEFREFIERVKPLQVKEKPASYDVDKLLEADVWLSPSLVVEIGADEITRSQVHTAGRKLGPSKSGKAFEVITPGFALRFPKLVKFRDDKSPRETTTVVELERMHKLQGR